MITLTATATELLLQALEGHTNLALLDYPDHLNVGDHLIWLSTLQVLLKNGVEASYCSSLVDFSHEAMDRTLPHDAPILLSGGGNLGDIWPDSQNFRDEIISKYKDRPVIILPQSVHFAQSENARRVAKIFNSHGRLTIFTREKKSFDIAQSLFSNCRVHLAPDMTLWPEASLTRSYVREKSANPALYLRRTDPESFTNPDSAAWGFEDLEIDDWRTYRWAYAGRGKVKELDDWYWKIPHALNLYRELWQRGLCHPEAIASRLHWQFVNREGAQIRECAHSHFNRFSWSLIHDGLTQIGSRPFLVTDRLHGQITAHLLGVPSVLLPNSYHKNESFFATWMKDRGNCRFASSSGQVKEAIQELLQAH